MKLYVARVVVPLKDSSSAWEDTTPSKGCYYLAKNWDEVPEENYLMSKFTQNFDFAYAGFEDRVELAVRRAFAGAEVHGYKRSRSFGAAKAVARKSDRLRSAVEIVTLDQACDDRDMEAMINELRG